MQRTLDLCPRSVSAPGLQRCGRSLFGQRRFQPVRQQQRGSRSSHHACRSHRCCRPPLWSGLPSRHLCSKVLGLLEAPMLQLVQSVPGLEPRAGTQDWNPGLPVQTSLFSPQSEDSGAVCGDREDGEGSTPSDCPDSHLCCPLQSVEGTAARRCSGLQQQHPQPSHLHRERLLFCCSAT